ncbi:MAG: hypothetical protein PG979_000977 [Rickettsia asembonensis]|nr:MAG: hypothetical protein PG979_000977 [Rickettsia asembonensis]
MLLAITTIITMIWFCSLAASNIKNLLINPLKIGIPISDNEEIDIIKRN